jgi:ubiquinone/menaquinone biosynthesis C-methylase UbiE
MDARGQSPPEPNFGLVPEAQRRYRKQISESWNLIPGSRVLEIGCGQGEMSEELANSLGPEGRIVALDIARPDYGAPLTLAQATHRIKQTPLGKRIDFRFECDVLSPGVQFEDDAFDYVVFAHSCWYFSNPEELLRTLDKVRAWARRLCLTEWDLDLSNIKQLPHFLAVLIQGEVEAFKNASESNVRTPLSRAQIHQIVEKAGWKVSNESNLNTEGLQDADWEINDLRQRVLYGLGKIELPDKLTNLLLAQLDLLERLARPKQNETLTAFTLTANRVVSPA